MKLISDIGSENAIDNDSSHSINFQLGDVKLPAAAAKSDALDGLLHNIVNAEGNLNSRQLDHRRHKILISECFGRANQGLTPVAS